VAEIAAYDAIVAQYGTDVTAYGTAKTAYEKEVDTNTADYNKNKEEFDLRNAFSCLFGCDPFTFTEIKLRHQPFQPDQPLTLERKSPT